MVMDDLEKAELIREKTGVGYADAKLALDASGGNVLDAIVYLENEGKARPQTASYSTAGSEQGGISPEMAEAQDAYRQASEGGRFERGFERFCDGCRRVLRKGIDVTFVVDRHGRRILAVPVLVLVLALFAWAITLPVLVVGLFLECHYHFEGVGRVTVDVNEAMDKAASGAKSLKRDVMGHEKR